MNSLKEVYSSLQEQDLVKEAQAQASQQYGIDMRGTDPELIKAAQDYDYMGRSLAHTVMENLIKQAMDEEMPGASSDEKKKTLEETMAMARGEKKSEKKDEDKDKEEKSEMSEKKASIRNAILERMAEDPDYVSALIAKHYE